MPCCHVMMQPQDRHGRRLAMTEAAAVAVRVRKALAERFPGVRFSVRSRSYSLGAAVDVSWADGPSAAAVDKILGRFERVFRDEMTGEILSGGNLYVQGSRHFSAAFLRRVAEAVCRRYGVDVPEIKSDRDGTHAYVVDDGARVDGEYLQQLIHHEAHETADARKAAPQAKAKHPAATQAPAERPAMANPDGPATARQLFALHCILQADTRGWALTKAQASDLIDRAKRGEDVRGLLPA